MVFLHFFVGLPGSGKTTYANSRRKENDIMLDSDELRAQLLGSSEDQSNNGFIFNEMLNRAVEGLNSGKNVYYVACNVWSKHRINFLKQLRARVKVEYRAICNIMVTPISVCYERNRGRERGSRLCY